MARLKDPSKVPDFSAETVAAARALAATVEPEPVRNPDHLAVRFLGTKYRLLHAVPPLRWTAYQAWQRKVPGIAAYLNARTHHIDAVLRAELAAGIDQVVILGAGYDTRAFRFAGPLSAARVFEVDQAGTQRRKIALVRQRIGDPPAHLTFIEADLSTSGVLFTRLAENGFDSSRPAFFVWEGVSYYLRDEHVDAMLGEVCAQAAAGSSVIFDYLYRGVLDGTRSYPGSEGAVRVLRRRGQPYRFGVPEGDMPAFLAARGYTCEHDLPPAAMEARYLTRADGALAHRAFSAYGMCLARLP